MLKVKKVHILPYRPQANGLCERLNRTILNMLRVLLSQNDLEWDYWVPTIQAAINNYFHSSLGDIPHFILYGEDRRLPYELLEQHPTPVYGDGDYVRLAIARKQEAYRAAKEHLTIRRDKILEAQHKLSLRKRIEIGVLVFKQVVKGGVMPKLAPIFNGPLRVLDIRNNKALCKSLVTEGQEWVHFDSLKLAAKQYEEEFMRLNNPEP